MVMVFFHKMIEKFWSAVPRSGWFELGRVESLKCNMFHYFFTVAVVCLWMTTVGLNFKKSEERIAVYLANMLILFAYACSLVVAMVGFVKHKKSLLIPALVCFPLTCLFSVALFFAGIYFQTQG